MPGELEQTDYFASRYFDAMVLAHPDRWQKFQGEKNGAALMKRRPQPENTAIIASGGAGGGPLFAGYVADGLADAVVVGGPFAAPNAYRIYETGKFLGAQKGVTLVYNNFSGDFLNNDMAAELLEMDGIETVSIAVSDDIASAVGEPKQNRGGRCAIVYLIKLAASCAKKGMTPGEMRPLLERANARAGTLSATVDFETREIAYGKGFSGEPGIRTERHMDMARMAGEAAGMLLSDLQPKSGEELFLLVNRLRHTGYTDAYLAAGAFHDAVAAQHPVRKLRVGQYSNILDVYGYTYTVLCADGELCEYLEGDVGTDCFVV